MSLALGHIGGRSGKGQGMEADCPCSRRNLSGSNCWLVTYKLCDLEGVCSLLCAGGPQGSNGM